MWRERLWPALVELVFPSRCVFCRRWGSPFCRQCQAEATPVGEAVCVRCGQAMTERCLCPDCRRTPAGPLRGIRGVVFYGSPVSFAIHALKYRGMKELARPLAGYLIAYLQTHPLPFDGLVPVPLHPEREAARGFNQSALLAREVGRALRLPVHEGVIVRSRATPPQVHLHRQQRLENVKDAFAATRPGALTGGRFLLVDDVCTTGATLQAAAQALHEAGAGEIWALAVARAHPKPEPEPWQAGLGPAEVFIAWATMGMMDDKR